MRRPAEDPVPSDMNHKFSDLEVTKESSNQEQTQDKMLKKKKC